MTQALRVSPPLDTDLASVRGSAMPTEDQRQCRRPGVDPDWWHSDPHTRDEAKARELCLRCPLYWPCQELAVREGIPHGVWGGLNGEERKQLFWNRRGGRPKGFDKAIRAQIEAGLAARYQDERNEA